MFWTLVTGAIGGILLLAAIWLTEELTGDVVSWVGQRIGIGVVRLVTFGRGAQEPLSDNARFLGTLLGVGIMLAIAVWTLYLWRGLAGG